LGIYLSVYTAHGKEIDTGGQLSVGEYVNSLMFEVGMMTYRWSDNNNNNFNEMTSNEDVL